MPKISATIITYNEEANLARTLESLRFVDEIIVVDSQSTDLTVSIAESFGAKVFQNKFINYGNQKNFAADQASNEWILNIDADEVVSEQLKENIQANLNSETIIYALDRLNYYCGKPIRFGGWYPDYQNRLYQKSKARWSEPEVHEWLSALSSERSAVKKISGKLLHYSFKSIEDQIERNKKYSLEGSKQLIKNNRNIYYLTPSLRAIWKFFSQYILKLGLLDGKYGYIISRESASAVYYKYLMARKK